jgi:TetR/AcrR family transcriptional regulator, cholesterol catabolism regulator
MIDQSRRDNLLAKAAQLFREKGYHATTMKDIAAELEILPGSLYHHIESKESLLLEIMRRGIEVLMERVRPIATSDLPPELKLRELIRIHVVSIAEHPDVLSVFLHELKSLPRGRRGEQMQLRDEYDRLLSAILEEGIARKIFRPVSPRVITFAILGMLNWLYAWYRPDGALSPEEIAQEYYALIWQGLTMDHAGGQDATTQPDNS